MMPKNVAQGGETNNLDGLQQHSKEFHTSLSLEYSVSNQKGTTAKRMIEDEAYGVLPANCDYNPEMKVMEQDELNYTV